MIGRVVGRVIAEEPTLVLIDVRGVGYELTCPVGTLGRAETAPDGDVILIVHTALRQDALELFGFATSEDRYAFRQLIHVPNVGPKLAIAVLSALPLAELVEAIEQQQAARLTRVPGVGKKTAERLLLELRGKLTPSLARVVLSGVQSGPAAEREKLLSALTGLGYKPAEAERATDKTLAESPGVKDLSALLRVALRALGS
jgi:holliday junction DNA helicase RuvA